MVEDQRADRLGVIKSDRLASGLAPDPSSKRQDEPGQLQRRDKLAALLWAEALAVGHEPGLEGRLADAKAFIERGWTSCRRELGAEPESETGETYLELLQAPAFDGPAMLGVPIRPRPTTEPLETRS